MLNSLKAYVLLVVSTALLEYIILLENLDYTYPVKGGARILEIYGGGLTVYKALYSITVTHRM